MTISLQYDGSSNFVTLPSEITLDGDFVITVDFKTTATLETNFILSLAGNSSHYFVLWADGGYQFRLGGQDSTKRTGILPSTQHTITYRRTAGVIYSTLDGGTEQNDGAVTATGRYNVIGKNTASPTSQMFEGELFGLTVDKVGSPVHNFDPNATNGTGSVLKDTLGAGSTDGAIQGTVVWIDSAAGNPNAPVANAGPDQNEVGLNTLVTLSALGSTDDVGITSYLWSQTAGTAVTLSDVNAAEPTFTTTGTEETFTFQVEVTDADNLSSTDTVVISTVTNATAPPVADAGSDSSVLSEGVYQLRGVESVDNAGKSHGEAGHQITGFLWEQVSGTPTVTLDTPNSIVTTFTAPTVTEATPLGFRLTVTAAGVTDTALVTITVRTVAELPTANAGADQVNVTGNVSLSGLGSTDDVAIGSYRWRQIAGAYAKLDDFALAQPTFTTPSLSNRNAFAQDIFGKNPIASTPSVLQVPIALSKLIDISYDGCFKISNASAANSAFDSSQVASGFTYNPTNNSVFMAGKGKKGIVGEFAIPATLSQDTDPALITNAAILQDFYPVLTQNTVGRLSSSPSDELIEQHRINGLRVFNGSLIISSEIWYDGDANNLDNLQVIANANDLTTGNKGFLQLAGGAHSAGWIGEIPADMQTALGGTHYTGWANNYSINERYSTGPSLFVFNPQDVIDADINVDRTIPTTAILDYSTTNPIVADWNPAGESFANPIWGSVTNAFAGILLPNSDYYLVIGKHGGMNDGLGYKPYNENGEYLGGYGYLNSADQGNYFWVYSVTDMLAATNTYDPQPFAYGRWSHPLDNLNEFTTLGADYDPVNNKLYLMLGEAGATDTNRKSPVILVYTLAAKAQEVTTVGSDSTEMIFELEVTDTTGLEDTDVVSIILGSAAGIPVSLRDNFRLLNSHLLSQGRTGSAVDNINAWLSSEGFSGSINDKMYNYLGSLGYTGSLMDRLRAWELS